MGDSGLLNGLRAFLASVPGAPERERLLSLLSEAKTIQVDDVVTSSISDTLASRSWMVEQNLDFLMLPYDPVWIEWSEKARGTDIDLLQDGVQHPERVGVLLARADEDVIGCSVAWQLPDGRVDLAPAFVSINSADMAQHSQQARHRYSKVSTESWARIMSLIFTSIPKSFLDEMEELQDVKEGDVDIEKMSNAARREVSAEALFVVAILVFLSCGQRKITEGDAGDLVLSHGDKNWRSSFWPSGFSRKNGFSGTYLRYKP